METAKRKSTPRKQPKAKRAKNRYEGIKKPTSGYLYFVSDYRIVLKKKGENMSKVKDISRLCGVAWRAMTDEEKNPYNKKHAEDRARYLKEKEAFDKKMGKDPTKPKRAQTAYFFFLAEFRKEMAGKTLEEGKKIPSLAGERWKELTPSEKKKYEEMVEKDKVRYEKEMEEWKKNNPEQPKKPVSRKRPPSVPSSDDDDDDSDGESEEEEEDSDDDSD